MMSPTLALDSRAWVHCSLRRPLQEDTVSRGRGGQKRPSLRYMRIGRLVRSRNKRRRRRLHLEGTANHGIKRRKKRPLRRKRRRCLYLGGTASHGIERRKKRPLRKKRCHHRKHLSSDLSRLSNVMRQTKPKPASPPVMLSRLEGLITTTTGQKEHGKVVPVQSLTPTRWHDRRPVRCW
jgi:hypothetical protein